MASRGPTPEQMETARRWLARASADAGSDDPALAAMHVYEKLRIELDPLLGPLGVRMLFARSAELTRAGFALLGPDAVTEDATKLRNALRAGDPHVASDASAALFGTFLSLVTIFIGERLTTQALQRAWPTTDPTEPAGTEK